MADFRFGSIVAEEHGTGPAVVMVHGLGGTSNSFQTLMPALGEFRVLRPDLPGAGRSGYRPGAPGIAGLATSVKNLLQAAQVERAHFVGHSMGTLVCQHLAVESPRLVASLTLFGAIIELSPAAKQGFKDRAASAREHGMAGIAETISTGSIDEASRLRNPVTQAFVRESLIGQNPTGYASHCDALSDMRAVDHSRIECSTILIAGERDPVAPTAMSRELATKIRGARVEVIADIGHWIMVEAPKRSAEILLSHLHEQLA